MMARFRIPVLLGLLLTVPGFLSAQTAEEWRSRYPGELALIKNHSLHYRLRMENGKPVGESEEWQEIQFIGENAGSLMTRYAFFNSGFHPVQEYEAYTRTAGGKKMEVKDFKTTHSTGNGIFYDDIQQTSFDFPGITPGATGCLRVKKKHPEPSLFMPFYFSRSIPVRHAELKVTFPKEINVRYHVMGQKPELIKFSSSTRRGETTYEFSVDELPREPDYADAPDNAYYAPHVIFYIDSYQDGGKTVSFLSSLDDLYRLGWTYIRDINKTVSPELRAITDSLVKDLPEPRQRAQAIYRWVQQHIKYVAFEEGMEGFVPREANLVCTRRYGDCKDMSSILMSMLRTAGLPAYFAWIGTRSLPYDYTTIHLPICDNHMIAAVQLDTGFVFLDGTDSYCEFGAVSSHIQGKEALVGISEKEYRLLRVPETPGEQNVLRDTTFITLTEKGITGQVSQHLSGYFAMDMHRSMNRTNDKNREKLMQDYIGRGSNKFRLTGFDLNPGRSLDEYRLNGRFELPDYAKKLAGEWYINLHLEKQYEKQEIDYPRRTIPLENEFRNRAEYITILHLPEGYKAASLPENKSYHTDTFGFDIRYETDGRRVILKKSFTTDYLLLQPPAFPAWNKVLEALFPCYKETIRLIKL